MKTSSALRIAPSNANPVADRTLLDQRAHSASVASLVERASRGDKNAVTAIAIAYRWVILEVARDALGPCADDAEDVLQEFLLLLLEGHYPYSPRVGAPGTWIRRTVCSLAKSLRATRERGWDGP